MTIRHRILHGSRLTPVLAIAALAIACTCTAEKTDSPPAPAISASAATTAKASASAAEAPAASAAVAQDVVGIQQLLVAWKGADGAAPTVTRTKDDAKKRATDALAKIKAGSFEAAVKELSDDVQTKASGGAIGNITRGAMPKAYEDAAFALKVGEVAGPIETTRGYFVIKRVL